MPASTRTSPFVVLASVILIGACGAGEQPPQLVEGTCGDVFGSDVCTWALVQGEQVIEFGATVPVAAIQAAPAEGEVVFPPVQIADVALPAVVAQRTGIQNLRMHWEHHGHPPGPYLVPHFDFHFYAQSPAETDAIDCSDTAKPAAPPAGYVLPDVSIPELGEFIGLCVPAMGMHALRARELESEEPFEATMVAGYYGGDPIFIEPMITREKLLAEESFTLDVPMLDGAAQGVRYPTAFRADYDAETRAYRFAFSAS